MKNALFMLCVTCWLAALYCVCFERWQWAFMALCAANVFWGIWGATDIREILKKQKKRKVQDD